MKIIEVTNPGNIGAYKNTPNSKPISIKHTKPVRGSYVKWRIDPILESKDAVLSDYGLTWESVEDAIYSSLRDRYENINKLVDSDVISAEAQSRNEQTIRNFIRNQLLPRISSRLEIDSNANPLDIQWILSKSEVNFRIKRLISNLLNK